MTSRHEFQPNWASAPGDTIADILRERGVTVGHFARSIRQTNAGVNELLEGRAAVSIGVARQLQRVLGGSVEFWMTRDYQYRQDSARLHAADDEWLNALPVGDMIKFGWLTPVPRASEEMASCLQFFGVPSVSEWQATYAALSEMTVFRTSTSFESRPAAVAAWLRKGEIDSQGVKCGRWNRKRFDKCLGEIRSLTRAKDPNYFVPRLQNFCAAAGVAIVVVRAPSGCRASGATRFLSEQKALMQFSFRYLTDDHFWFTFFHEASHLLLHGEKSLFIEGVEGVEALSTDEEREANEFAARTLIPDDLQPALMDLPPESRAVIRFASNAGISPGIVVGQMQHLKIIRPHQLNHLKRRFRWRTDS